MSTIKRKALSLQDKINILNLFDENSRTKNQTQLAAELQLPVSTLRTILKKKEEIKERYRLGDVQRKKQKVGKFHKLEKVLVEWLHQSRALKLPISGPIICKRARKIAKSLNITDFNASNGWIDRFKNRHGIVYRQISRESETVSQQDNDIWMKTLSELLQNYEPRNIFNAGVFSLFLKLMPDKSFVLEGETSDGDKANKERLTVLACANSDGSEKLHLLVIGKAKNQRCFKNVESIPVTYDAQPRACMTGLRFMKWLRALDDHFQINCRRIILFVDHCSTHPKSVELQNIKLVYLPSNMSSKLLPMDQGIIKVLKHGYKTRLMRRYLKEMEDPDSKQPSSVHDAILNIAAAWDAISPETIQNCFKKAGFRSNEVDAELHDDKASVLQNCPRYSSFDNHVSPCDIQPMENVIEDVSDTKKEAISDDVEENDTTTTTTIISNAEALSAVKDLRLYLTSLSQSEDALQKLNYIENLIIANASKS